MPLKINSPISMFPGGFAQRVSVPGLAALDCPPDQDDRQHNIMSHPGNDPSTGKAADRAVHPAPGAIDIYGALRVPQSRPEHQGQQDKGKWQQSPPSAESARGSAAQPSRRAGHRRTTAAAGRTAPSDAHHSVRSRVTGDLGE